MAHPNLTLDEAEELAHIDIPVVPDVRMPSGWRLSVDKVPVAPVPEPGIQLFAHTVGLYRARLSLEALRDPLYAPNNPAWSDMLAADRDERLHAFVGLRPPVEHNRARRHQLRDGRNFKEVVAPHRAHATVDAIPSPINAGFKSVVRRVAFDCGGSGGRASILLGSGDHRTVASRAAGDGVGSSRAPPPET